MDNQIDTSEIAESIFALLFPIGLLLLGFIADLFKSDILYGVLAVIALLWVFNDGPRLVFNALIKLPKNLYQIWSIRKNKMGDG